MTHYICTGDCEGVSDKPGVCKTENCPKLGEPLEECDCKEDTHLQKLEKEAE